MKNIPVFIASIDHLFLFFVLEPIKFFQDNERRLTGKHETSSIHDFSAGVANRSVPAPGAHYDNITCV